MASRYVIIVSGIVAAAILVWNHILSPPHQSSHFPMIEEAPLKGRGALPILEGGGALPILVQSTTSNNVTDCTAIHIGVVAIDYDSCRQMSILVNSLLAYTHGNVHFHFLVDSYSGVILGKLMDSWQLPLRINVSFYKVEEARKAIMSQDLILGASKHTTSLALAFPFIVPSYVSVVMILAEPNVVFTVSIRTLWEQEYNTVVSTLSAKGMDAKIFLFNVEAMRTMEREEIIKLFQPFLEAPDGNQLHKSTDKLDRVLAGLKLEQCCVVTTADKCLQTATALTTVETYGCPQNALKKVLAFNGSDLPENSSCILQPKSTTIVSTSDPCREFRKTLIYRTHPYYVGHPQHHVSPDPFDVTMVTHVSFDRLSTFMRVLKSWSGPASVAVYVNETESLEIIKFIEKMLPQRKDVMFHIVYKAGEFYPINYLRNVAWNYSDTPYIFITDADLIPVPTMYESLRSSLKLQSYDAKKTAYVVPAFETLSPGLPYPLYKQVLVTKLQYKTITPFKWKYFKEGHKRTDYDKWKKATEPYMVKWHKLYEPYIVVHYNTSRFDERFVGYGSNKASHIEELYAQQYSYIVLPNVYTIHYPHSTSTDEAKFRGRSVRSEHHKSSSVYFHCIDDINREFRKELQTKYGVKI